jgi:Protein of unknown function (DUF2510)
MGHMADTFTPQVTESWEYAILQADEGLIAKINDLDVEGWHFVSVIAADSGQRNVFAAIVRRAIDPLPPHPAGTPAGWYPDPSDRYDVRYWNGWAWTHSVGTEGHQQRDAPTRRLPTPGLVQR